MDKFSRFDAFPRLTANVNNYIIFINMKQSINLRNLAMMTMTRI